MEFLMLFVVLAIGALVTLRFYRENFNNDTEIILFYAPWCSASRNFLPVWKDIKNKKGDFKSNVYFTKVNVEKNNDKAVQYDVKFLPTVFINKNGNKKKVPRESMNSLDRLNNYLLTQVL